MRKLRVILLVGLVCFSGLILSGCTSSEPDIAEYNNLLSSAKLSVSNKEYTEGLKTYISITDKFPSKLEGYKGVLEVLLSKNLFEQAGNIADSAGSRLSNPESAQIYLQLGDKYYGLADFTNAAKYYKKALEKDSENSLVKLANARVLLKQGDFDGADRLLSMNDDSSDTYFETVLLKTAYQRTNLDAARALLDKVNSRKSSIENLNLQYGWLNDALINAVAKKDDQLYVAATLSSAYINMGYPKLAINLLSPLKEKMTEYWDGLYFLGRAYFDSGEYTLAADTLQNALLIVPDSFELQLLLGKVYFVNKDLDKAMQAYDTAMPLVNSDNKLSYLKDYFNLLFAQGQYTKATSILNTIESLGDSNWLRLAYIKVYYQSQSYDKMKVHFDALAKKTDLSQEEKLAYFSHYINYALETGDETLAKNLLDEMQKIDSLSALYKYEQGKYLFQTGDSANAKLALEKAIEFDLEGIVAENAQKLLAKIE